ncbi:hypothetical protein [Dyadobacter pollutisoli]|uniref:Uncharacterized protein n=1 Tax=Dyadobacter pollutisoli TaxID=2910158 RepID=A0A9E8SJP5_9BACT|nr:hypothetical protein [Dyadobacter pollutisoli]WAC11073.1 hypothetical protein ON006_25480 [Dyadobacter pollutisoli]
MGKYLSISLSIAIFLIFGFTLLHNALNAPSFDDYDTTLNFIRRFYYENFGFGIRRDILLSRHNEHRILFSKSTAALYYYLFHEINFTNLVVFQNVFLVGFFALIMATMKEKGLLSAETLLWAAVFLSSLAFWQVTFYYWGGIQHYTVFFFSFLSLFLLNKASRLNEATFLIALLAVIIAVLSFGNGFITLFLGAFLLFAQKKWSLLIVWGSIALGLLLITFLPLPPSVHTASGVAFNAQWMARLLLTFLGSFFYVNPSSGQHINIILCMCIGLFVLLCWIWLFLKGYAFRNPLLYCMLSMPILTGIIISISRFESKAAGGIAPRYMFFSATIPVLLVLIFMEIKILKKEHLKYMGFLGVLLWGIVFFNNYKALVKSNEQIVTTLNNWEKDHTTPLIYYQEAEEFSEILNWAVTAHVISIPDAGKNFTEESERK